MRVRGFTLIELLIVLVLISVMAGMAMLAIGNDGKDRSQWDEAKRLAILLNMAEQESLLRGAAMALELFQNGYRFVILTDSGWEVEEYDDLFRSRSLQQGMQAQLVVDGETQYLNKDLIPTQAPAAQILLMPEGLAETIEIRMVYGQHSLSVANSHPEGWVATETGLVDWWH